MSHLADKAKTLAQAIANLHAKVEKDMDDRLRRVSDISANMDTVMVNLSAVHDDMQAGVDELNEVAKSLTNQ